MGNTVRRVMHLVREESQAEDEEDMATARSGSAGERSATMVIEACRALRIAQPAAKHMHCAKLVRLLCPAGSPPTPRRGVHFAAEAAAPRAAAAAGGGGGAHGLLSRALRPTVLAARQRSLHNLLDLGVSASAELAIAAVDAQVPPTGWCPLTCITAGLANAELGLVWA